MKSTILPLLLEMFFLILHIVQTFGLEIKVLSIKRTVPYINILIERTAVMVYMYIVRSFIRSEIIFYRFTPTQGPYSLTF